MNEKIREILENTLSVTDAWGGDKIAQSWPHQISDLWVDGIEEATTQLTSLIEKGELPENPYPEFVCENCGEAMKYIGQIHSVGSCDGWKAKYSKQHSAIEEYKKLLLPSPPKEGK